MSASELPVYTVMTIGGRLDISFPEEGPPIYRGSEDAQWAFGDALRMITGRRGRTYTPASLEADHLANFCNRPDHGLVVFKPISIIIESIIKESVPKMPPSNICK